jgi:putative transposase
VPPSSSWDTLHLDGVFLTINCERHYLWLTVDHNGNILDILVQQHRDKTAAKKFLRKLRKGLRYVPRGAVTYKIRSYGATQQEVLISVKPYVST